MEIAKPKTPKWATIIDQRFPQKQKHHFKLADAKLALLYGWGSRARGGKLYEFINSEWVLRLEILPGTEKEQAKRILNAIEPLST